MKYFFDPIIVVVLVVYLHLRRSSLKHGRWKKYGDALREFRGRFGPPYSILSTCSCLLWLHSVRLEREHRKPTWPRERVVLNNNEYERQICIYIYTYISMYMYIYIYLNERKPHVEYTHAFTYVVVRSFFEELEYARLTHTHKHTRTLVSIALILSRG